MLFSKRREWAKKAVDWCFEHDIPAMPMNILSALDALGLFKKLHNDDELEKMFRDGFALTVVKCKGGFEAHLNERNSPCNNDRWRAADTIPMAIDEAIAAVRKEQAIPKVVVRDKEEG